MEKMASYFLSQDNLLTLLDSLQKDYAVFVPVKKGEKRFYRRYPEGGAGDRGEEAGRLAAMVIGEVRAFEPLKAFFFKARQRVAEGFRDELPAGGRRPYCIVGVKACDLQGFKVQDLVFQSDDYTDPFYKRQREQNLVISSDCTCALDTCYCLALNGRPYPRESFDLNLADVPAGFIAEEGSARGKKLVSEHASLFEPASAGLLGKREEQRARVSAEVEANLQRHGIPGQERLPGVIDKNYNSPLWKEEAQSCVECGACNTICPTCHCFLLYDQQREQDLIRLRVWDSCLIKDFARVAGGANPRPYLWMRLRNRFEKKFDFFPKRNNLYACTGCGRCISACPAKIDIRKVLRRLVENV